MSHTPRYIPVAGADGTLEMCERCGAVVHFSAHGLHDHFHAVVNSHGRDVSHLAEATGVDLVRS